MFFSSLRLWPRRGLFARALFAIGPWLAFAPVLLIVALVAAWSVSSAFAQSAAPAPSSIALAPFVDALRPYVDILLNAAITAAFAVLAIVFKRYAGVTLSAALETKLIGMAQTEAGVAVAAAEDNLAKRAIAVSSPIVANAAARIAAHAPDLAAAYPPSRLQAAVAGEIGKLQAAMTAAPPAVSASVATAPK